MKDDTVESFLRSLGYKSPTPGGGAVSALNGAIAAAQLKMICEYTKDEEVNKNTESLARQVDNFIKLAEDDSAAFEQVSEAYKNKDSSLIDPVLIKAVSVSMDIVAGCEQLLSFCEIYQGRMNKNLKADLIVVLANLRASVQSAQAMEKVNYEAIKDNKPEDIKEHIGHCDVLIGRIDRLASELGDVE